MQITYRGPAENGVYAKESLDFIFSLVNLNGSNFCVKLGTYNVASYHKKS